MLKSSLVITHLKYNKTTAFDETPVKQIGLPNNIASIKHKATQ